MSYLQRIEHRAKVDEIGDIDLELSRVAFENKKRIIILSLAIAFEAMMFLYHKFVEKAKLEATYRLMQWVVIPTGIGCLILFGIGVYRVAHGLPL